MVETKSSRKEVIALAFVAFVVVGLVGFVTLSDDDEFEIDTNDPVDVIDVEGPKVPNHKEQLAEQKKREAMGLPTGNAKQLSGKSHLHGGYGATFRVVDKESRTGIANAVVYFMPQKTASEIDWKWRKAEVVRRRGQRLKADHWGDVRIQNFIGSALVISEHKGQYGELYIKSFHNVMTDKHELLMESDPAVKIQVINGDGRGVKGVPVALWRDNEEAHSETNGVAPKRILIWTGSTYGPNGIALARRSLSAKSSEHAGDEGWNGPLASHLAKGGVYATFYFPPLIPQALYDHSVDANRTDSLNDSSGVTRALLEQVHEVSVTSEGPQCRPLELPETGAVKLVLYSDDGSMYEKPCVVWIGAFKGERGKGPGHSQRSRDFDPKLQSISKGSIPFVAERGIVTLPHVGLFSDFDITVMPLDQSHDAVSMVVNGPTKAKQIRTVSVPLGPERAVLEVRVKDMNGNWYAGKQLDVALAVPGINVDGLATKHKRVKTDAEGVFSVRVPVEFSLYPKLEMRILSMRRGSMQQPPYVSTVITTPKPASTKNVGTLTLAVRGLICRGRILDEKMRPLANASIVITRDPFGEDRMRVANDSRTWAMTQSSQGPEIVAEFTSNKQGYFTYGGYIEAGVWEMTVSHVGDKEERETRFEFEPGTNNMQVKVPVSSRR